MLKNFPWQMAYLAPRGIGPSALPENERDRIQIRRRYYLLGQSQDGMRVWDVRRAIQALHKQAGGEERSLWLQGQSNMAGVALYASLFEPNIKRLDLHDLPTSHKKGPTFLNVLRHLDMPHAAAMAAERSQLVLYDTEAKQWDFSTSTAAALNWDKKQIQFRKIPN